MPTEPPDTETRILDAAHEVFLRRGTHGARMQEIAEKADVNQALLHYYFRSKERLAEAVFQKAVAGFLPRLVEELGSNASIEEKVATVVEVELDFFTDNPYLPGYFLSELNYNPERGEALFHKVGGERMRATIKKLDEQLKVRAREGGLQPIAAPQFVINLFSLCIFPFAARPMLRLVFEMDDAAFAAFIEERKRTLPGFFLSALQSDNA